MKLFFVNIYLDEFSKAPFLEWLLESMLIYLIDYYMQAIEDSPGNYYEHRYISILELLGLLLTRGCFRTALLEKFTESGFLTIYTSIGYAPSKKSLFLELLGIFNKLISSKLKLVGVTVPEIDAFMVVNGVVDFVWLLFLETLPKTNLLFSACANFFREVGLNNHDDIILCVMEQHRREIGENSKVERYFSTYELKCLSLVFRNDYLRGKAAVLFAHQEQAQRYQRSPGGSS